MRMLRLATFELLEDGRWRATDIETKTAVEGDLYSEALDGLGKAMKEQTGVVCKINRVGADVELLSAEDRSPVRIMKILQDEQPDKVEEFHKDLVEATTRTLLYGDVVALSALCSNWASYIAAGRYDKKFPSEEREPYEAPQEVRDDPWFELWLDHELARLPELSPLPRTIDAITDRITGSWKYRAWLDMLSAPAHRLDRVMAGWWRVAMLECPQCLSAQTDEILQPGYSGGSRLDDIGFLRIYGEAEQALSETELQAKHLDEDRKQRESNVLSADRLEEEYVTSLMRRLRENGGVGFEELREIIQGEIDFAREMATSVEPEALIQDMDWRTHEVLVREGRAINVLSARGWEKVKEGDHWVFHSYRSKDIVLSRVTGVRRYDTIDALLNAEDLALLSGSESRAEHRDRVNLYQGWTAWGSGLLAVEVEAVRVERAKPESPEDDDCFDHADGGE